MDHRQSGLMSTPNPDLDIEATAPDSAVTWAQPGRQSPPRRGPLPRGPGQMGHVAAVRCWPRRSEACRPPPRVAGGWRYERKLDGLRRVAVRNGDQVELWSQPPVLQPPASPRSVAALARLRPQLHLRRGDRGLRPGPHQLLPAPADRPGSAPPSTACSTCSISSARDTTALPLTDRQALLAQAARRDLRGAHDRDRRRGRPGRPARPGPAPKPGGARGQARPGRRTARAASADWQKLKCSASQDRDRRVDEAVGGRTSGALLVWLLRRRGPVFATPARWARASTSAGSGSCRPSWPPGPSTSPRSLIPSASKAPTGPTRPGRGGALHRMDGGRPPPPPQLRRPAGRPGPSGRPSRAVDLSTTERVGFSTVADGYTISVIRRTETVVLRAEPESASEARRLTRRLCEDVGLDPETRDTAILLTSETVTNAVVHGRSDVRLTVTADPWWGAGRGRG